MLRKYDLRLIEANEWNPNEVDPINQEKLERSLEKYGQQMPIIIREIEGDTGGTVLQIVDGEHRYLAAKGLGWEDISAINIGVCTDQEAKRRTIIANTRYGQDDNEKLFDILQSDGVFETTDDILSTLPIDETELASLFSSEEVDFSDLDIDLDSDGEDVNLNLDAPAPNQTHRILRFKVSIEDADRIEDDIDGVKTEQGYSGADGLTNAGDALVYLLNGKLS
jgi:ParB family chromosome partitioning protein